MTRPSLIATALLVSACGAFTPNIDASINGHVDTSGTVTVTEDLDSLLAFFTTECRQQLGPTATPDQVMTCAATMTNDFIAMAAGTTPPKGP